MPYSEINIFIDLLQKREIRALA